MATDWIRLISTEQAAKARSSLRGLSAIGVVLTLFPFVGLLGTNGMTVGDTILTSLLLGGATLAVSWYGFWQYRQFEQTEFGPVGVRIVWRGRVHEYAWQQVDVRFVGKAGGVRIRTPVRTLHLHALNVGEHEFRALAERIDVAFPRGLATL